MILSSLLHGCGDARDWPLLFLPVSPGALSQITFCFGNWKCTLAVIICLLTFRAASLLTPPRLLCILTHISCNLNFYILFIRGGLFLQLSEALNITWTWFKTCPFHKTRLYAVIFYSIKYILYHQKFYGIFKNEFLLSLNALRIILRDPAQNAVMFICNCQKMACKTVSVFYYSLPPEYLLVN